MSALNDCLAFEVSDKLASPVHTYGQHACFDVIRGSNYLTILTCCFTIKDK